jgi:hypothetical protein
VTYQLAGDAHSSAAPDPTFAFAGGLCCPTLEFCSCLLDYDYVLHIVNSLFCIVSNYTIVGNFHSVIILTLVSS